jgi:uncharacterized protein (DUF924 family)
MKTGAKFDELHETWFGPEPANEVPQNRRERWFKKDPTWDRTLRDRFGDIHPGTDSGPTYASLRKSIRNRNDRVGYLLLLDQISRNIFRDQPEAFAHDEEARRQANSFIESGLDRTCSFWERAFIYIPFQHSEDLKDQERSLELYKQLAADAPPQHQESADEFREYARQHHEVIERFGRFPHRNKILDRTSTPKERDYLDQPGSGF